MPKVSVDTLSSSQTQQVEHIMTAHGFEELTETQEQALNEGILEDGNHLLVAETGNGKTLCAESVVSTRVEQNEQIAYLVPSRQLVRDKAESLREWTPDDVTVASGRGKYHAGDIIVATFNSFYQAVLRGVGQSRSVGLVVLDDFHELYSSFIGPELEKAIAAAMHQNSEIFAMSATVGNPMEIADWLDATLTVSDEERSIPIREEIAPRDHSSKKESLANFVSENATDKPFLVFNFAKSWTESRAKEIAETRAFTDMASDKDLVDVMRQKVDGALPDRLQSLAEMMNNGVAYHHADLPRNVREWIEDLYYQEKIGCLCATTTIAYGFDSPVKSVVVADMKRRGQWVGKWEYQQWIGRAARPGFGYDEGFAYVLTNNPQVVRSEFFAPRELEPVETHIDSPSRFRKLLLELIDMGWDTPETIEEFISNTLFWNQIQQDGAWGRSFDEREERVERKLRETATWLEQNDFIRENRTASKFDTTPIGESTVEFLFDTNRSHSLQDVRSLLNWMQSIESVDQLPLLARVTDTFGLGMSDDTASNDVKQLLKQHGLQVSSDTVSAAVLHLYWAQNMATGDIEDTAGIDAAYISSTAYRISDTLSAVEHLLDVSQLIVPEWFDTYVYQIQRGVRVDEVPYVRNVQGLGRNRIRTLRDYFKSEDGAEFTQNDNDTTIWTYLSGVQDYFEETEETTDMLSSNISGFGPKLSERLMNFHTDATLAQKFKESSATTAGGTTTLGDFE